MSSNFRVKICMSLMRALLGEVTPDVRAVLARPHGDHGIRIEFYLDGDNAEQFMESASEIETEVMADYPAEMDISHAVVRLDAPGSIPSGEDGIFVFRRKEAGHTDPMKRTVSVTLYGEPGNNATLHFQGRRNPAVAMQADTLGILIDDLRQSSQRLHSGDPAGGLEELEGVLERLMDIQSNMRNDVRRAGDADIFDTV